MGGGGSVSLKPLYRYSTLLTGVLFVFFIDLVSFASSFSGNFQNFLLSRYGILRRAVGAADVWVHLLDSILFSFFKSFLVYAAFRQSFNPQNPSEVDILFNFTGKKNKARIWELCLINICLYSNHSWHTVAFQKQGNKTKSNRNPRTECSWLNG